MKPPASRNPKVMHGALCFTGTRVTVQSLFDHIEAGYTVDDFIEQFPSVSREQVVESLEQLRQRALQQALQSLQPQTLVKVGEES